MLLPTVGHLERMVYEMAVDSIEIGKRIKQYRLEKQLSQEELGARIGVTRKHLSKIELGNRAPTLDLLILIANALEVSADDLLAKDLNKNSSVVGKELHTILQDCHPAKKEMLIKILKFMKELLTEYKI